MDHAKTTRYLGPWDLVSEWHVNKRERPKGANPPKRAAGAIAWTASPAPQAPLPRTASPLCYARLRKPADAEQLPFRSSPPADARRAGAALCHTTASLRGRLILAIPAFSSRTTHP